MPTKTANEWFIPLVQVLGKNYICLFLNISSLGRGEREGGRNDPNIVCTYE
jgi:hypothetical protein